MGMLLCVFSLKGEENIPRISFSQSSVMPATSYDLLLVFTEPSNRISEQVFHDWYDNEHIPLRRNVPGFRSCVRLVQADGKTPTWGAIYEIESLDVLKSEPYVTLFKTQSDREKEVLGSLAVLDRRVYTRNESSSEHTNETFDGLRPGNVVVYVSFDIGPEHEDELHRWYEEEHTDMLKKVPGWLQSRRFILQDAGVSGSNAERHSKRPPKFLAAHFYESADMQQTAEWNAARSTPWRIRMMGMVTNAERRIFTVHNTL